MFIESDIRHYTGDVVISGISGRFPDANNIQEFWQKLVNGDELYTADDRRWPVDFLNLPKRGGKLYSIEKCDNGFFDITDRETNIMDPQIRLLHEVTYEAIFDSGIRPQDLRGTNTGFFIGVCYSDAFTALGEKSFAEQEEHWINAAARLMYSFDFRGPTFQVDTACASSFSCLHEGILAMKVNRCKQMVIGGVACHLDPAVTSSFRDITMLSEDGRSKCLDAGVDGYCRSEAIVSLFVQRKSEAKRIYATVLQTNTNCDGFKPEGITYPGFQTQTLLMNKTIDSSKVDPLDISYIECHLTGTSAGDPIESNAILSAYRQNSKKPIKFGCLKSNMGHTEGASANCAIVKVALAFQNHCLPPNLNFKNPNPNIRGLFDGTIVPVLKKIPFDDTVVPVNSFGFGGVNVHAILMANEKVMSKDSFRIIDIIPRLINVSGRTEEGIEHIFKWIEENRTKLTKEFLSLLNDVSKTPLSSGMICRGYVLLSEEETLRKKLLKQSCDKPLWFIFSALGCQWDSMAKGLMCVKPFSDSINNSAIVLQKVNIDLMSLIVEDVSRNQHSEDDIISVLVSIVAIQIALVDCLTFLGVYPDGIIGHSIGEVAAGYADGCLNAEEALLTGYYIAKCSKDCQQNIGAMAAIGQSWENTLKECPYGVYPACNNAKDSITVAGLSEKVSEFVTRMKSDGYFAKEVSCCNMAYHCPLVSGAFNATKAALTSVIRNPKERSNRWISTSLVKEANETHNKLCDAQYFANNVVSPVYFKEAVECIQRDACIVEIGPHFFLLPLIKRILGPKVLCVSLMKKDDEQSVNTLLSGFGDIYMSGKNIEIEKIYPKVEYPVPRETTSLSHLLKWNHCKDFYVPKYPDHFNSLKDSVPMNIDVMDPSFKFITGHCVDGRNLFPATGYLYLVWDRFASMKGIKNLNQLPIEFRNVSFKRATILPKNGQISFNVLVVEETGEFSVIEGGSICVSGRVSSPTEEISYETDFGSISGTKTFLLTSKDVYRQLRIRGYDYGPTFQGLVEAASDGSFGKVKWGGKWISFVDSLLHLLILKDETRNLSVPTHLEYLRCDITTLMQSIDKMREKSNDCVFDVFVDKYANILQAKGIVIKGLKATPISRKHDRIPTLHYTTFTAYSECFKHKENKNNLTLLRTLSDKMSSVNSTVEWRNGSIPSLNSENNVKLADLLQYSLDYCWKREEFTKLLNLYENAVTNDLFSLQDFETILKPQFDIITSNLFSKSVQVAEVTTNSCILTDLISKCMEGISIGKYSLLQTCEEQISVNSSVNVQKLKTPTFPSTISSIDLIIYKDHTLSFAMNSNAHENIFGTLITSAYVSLKSGGFFVILARDEVLDIENELLSVVKHRVPKFVKIRELRKLIEDTGFQFIGEKCLSNSLTSILVRKPKNEEPPVIVKCFTENYDWVDDLKKVVKSRCNRKIWLVADDCEVNGVVGLMQCLKKEIGPERIRCLIGHKADVKVNGSIPQYIIRKDLCMNVLLNNQWGFYAFVHLPDDEELKETEHAYLDVETKGDLSSFQWFEAPHKYWPSIKKLHKDGKTNLCHVYYAALNFKDVMVASGRIPLNAYPISYQIGSSIGMEYAGINDNGERIFGFAEHQAIASTLLYHDNNLTWKVPEHWTLEEAATVPVAYATAYYSLLIRGQLMPQETVLIHAGSGGVGQAAISICLAKGCKVFVTVGTEEKKHFLKSKYSQLKDSDFASSRNTDFEEHILTQTKGKGVDIILNSLSEEKLKASIRCLKDGGRFLEIGKYDLVQNNVLDVNPFGKTSTFHVICVAHLQHDFAINNNPRAKALSGLIRHLVQSGIQNNEVTPLKRHVFGIDKAEEAFRFMASGKHIGKVLIKIREETQKVTEPLKILAVPQSFFHPDKSFIILGGLGGFGLELAHWLIEKGATKLILTTRRPSRSNYENFMLQEFRKQGSNVSVAVNDALNLESAEKLINEANKLGPVGGIFNLAMVLKDDLMENQSVDSFKEVCSPKVTTTCLLDTLTRRRCPFLEYFVCFSSAAAGLGNVGQTNYAFANSVMERVCEKRRNDGLHGLAIQWGAVGDVGFVAESFGSNDVVIGGTVPQRLPSCFKVLDKLLQSQFVVCQSLVFTDNRSTSNNAKENLLKTVFHVLGIKESSNLDLSVSLANLGMDSLMCVEIKQGLERDYDLTLSTQEIRQLTIKDLIKISEKKIVQEKVRTQNVEQKAQSNDELFFEAPTEVFVQLNDVTQGHELFFLPPIEGKFDLMQNLVQYICRPIIGVNWVREMDQFESIQEVASFYVEKIIATYPQTEYDIVGYSTGAVIAFEMATQFQKRLSAGALRKIILLDGAPDPLKSFANGILDKTKSSDIETALSNVIIGFISMYLSNANVKRLDSSSLLEQKIIELSKINDETVKLKNFSSLVECGKRYAQKVKLLSVYKVDSHFKGDVKLLRSKDKISTSVDIETEQDYGLRKITEGNVEVLSFEGDHKTFLLNNADTIGNYLESQFYSIRA